MSAGCAIILMAKRPMAGKTKTRLCPTFSPEQAAQLYEALLRDTLALVNGVEDVQLAVAISPPDSLEYFLQITRPDAVLVPVEGANIGECLERSLGMLFEQGYCKAIALNTDGPSLPREHLLQAVGLLDEADLVLGPGEDGGYYLVGMKQFHPAIFREIPWSTGEVLSRTLAQAEALDLRAAFTPPWYDVDSPADAAQLQAELAHLPAERLVFTRAFFTQHSFGIHPKVGDRGNGTE